MKKLVFFLPMLTLVIASACNNEQGKFTSEQKTALDSLEKEVDDGHIAGMGKMGKLTKAQQEATRLLDSIGKLPAKAQQAAAPYKAKLDSLLKDLNYADMAMNKWMEEYKFDSAANDAKKRIEYLTDEKLKVGKVKEAILTSLQRADSLLQN